jgi:Na+/alanine symporter
LELTAFIETTLAQIYKENTGQFRGGPAFYIEED